MGSKCDFENRKSGECFEEASDFYKVTFSIYKKGESSPEKYLYRGQDYLKRTFQIHVVFSRIQNHENGELSTCGKQNFYVQNVSKNPKLLQKIFMIRKSKCFMYR